MNVLVIGGNGFIGSHLVDELLVNGHFVRVFDSKHEKYRKPNKAVDYRIADIMRKNELQESMIGIDVVFHLASSSVPGLSDFNITDEIRNGVFPTIHILHSMVQTGVKKIVYLSSGGAVYGHSGYSMNKEVQALNPISSYGINKVTIENYIRLFELKHGLDSLIIRPSNPYGPRQGHFMVQGVISTFLQRSFNNKPFEVFGDGENKKDYLFVEDLVKYIVHLFQKEESGIYNIGSGEGKSINELIEIINHCTEKTNFVTYSKSKISDVTDFVLDIKKLETSIGGPISMVSIEDGIKRTWDWVKNELSNSNE